MESSEGDLLNLERRYSKYKQLTKEQRQGILEKLLQQMKENNLKHSAINEVATAFRVPKKRTIKPNQISNEKNHSCLIKMFQTKLI